MRRRAALHPRRAAVMATLAVIAAAVAFLAPALFSDKVLAGDDVLLVNAPQESTRPADYAGPSNAGTYDSGYVFHPDLLEARRQLRDGHLPAWTQHVGTGRPLLAAQQAAPFYPPNAPAYVMDFWASLEWTALIKLLTAGLGMLALLRTLRLSWAGAALGAVTYMLCAHLQLWGAHPHSNVYVLTPLTAAFAIRTARSARADDAAGLAACTGVSLLAGQPPAAFIAGAFIVAPLALAFAVREPDVGVRRPRAIAGRLLLVMGGTAAGVVAAAVVLAPLAEALHVSSGNAERGAAGLARSAINTLAFPEMWGRSDKFELAGAPANFQERTLYFGVIPLLLAFAGTLVRRPAQAQVVVAASALAALLVTFVPRVAELLLEVPGFAATRLRLHIVIAFAGAVLAAYAADLLVHGTRAQRIRLAALVAMAGVAVPLQWLARHGEVYASFGDALRHLPVFDGSVTDGNAVRFGEVLGFAAYALVAAVGTALAALRPRWAPAVVAVFLAAVVLDDTAVGRGYVPVVDRDRVDVAAGPTLRFFEDRSRHGERVTGEHNMFGPNLANRWPANDPRAHALPAPERYTRLWQALGGQGKGTNLQHTTFGSATSAEKLLDVFSVRWVLSFDLGVNTPKTYRAAAGPGLEWPVWENLDVHPRARFVSSWQQASMEQALRRLPHTASARLESSPFLEDAPAPPAAGTRRAVPLAIGRDEPTALRIDVRAPRDGYVVLNDLYFPGWKAEVDGRRAEILPANVAFRAVAVPAGRHTVTFTYESAAVRWGVIAGVAAWLLILAVLLAGRARRRAAAPARAVAALRRRIPARA